MKPLHVLLVSWWYPPLSGGGVYRPLNFSRHFLACGERVTVLTAEPGPSDGVDESLRAQIPQDARVVRVPRFDAFALYGKVRGWLPRKGGGDGGGGESTSRSPQDVADATWTWKDRVSERLVVPDRQRNWVRPAAKAAVRALRDDPPDVILSTSPPHSMHLLAMRLREAFGCPWVADFRDPWVGNPFRGFKVPAIRALDEALERQAIRGADRIIANTPALERRLKQRFPERVDVRAITNGFDPALLEQMTPAPAVDGPLEIVHVGHLYGARSGRYLIEGLGRLVAEDPRWRDRVRVRLIGAIDQRDAFLADVKRLGLSEVLLCPGRIPHAEALAAQRDAPALLILGVEDDGPEVQVPGKLYEYFAARRPVLTLSRRTGAIEEVLERSKVPFELAEPDDPADIARAVERFVTRHEQGQLDQFDDEAIARFRYDRLAEEVRLILRDVASCAGAAS